MQLRLMLPFVALLLMALAPAPAAAPLDRIARDYVRLTLEAGTHEDGYVDAYYGPPEWAAAAKARPRSVAELKAAAAALEAEVRAADAAALTPIERQRAANLALQLHAAQIRLAMIDGAKFSFDDEAFGLFGVHPVLKPLADYDATLAEIDKLLPGPGPLWQRVDSWRNAALIPADKLDAVMQAAIAECRARTLAHIALPKGEKFTLEFVKNQPWSGYNWYKGNATSLIQVNTDLPVEMSRAVGLGCHEGYPGHHVYNVLLEQQLTRGRGWVEFSIYPLYSPMSLLAEGSANYGRYLAFPGDEQAAFEARTLYPLAGLDPALARRNMALYAALERLGGARLTIARDYLDGHIDRAAALALTQKYLLLSPERAAQSVKFTEHYRSYVINYGIGQEMVRAHIEGAGPDQTARWTAMQQILSSPPTPADLGAR
jgi:hypothetical protein